MRSVLALVLLGGCFAVGGGGGSTRPGVMPMLSELPGDPAKRDAILDQSNRTPGPEHRKPVSPRQRKAETAAATAAAVIGGIFSKTQNVTLGMAGTFDENTIVAPAPVAPKPSKPSSEEQHDDQALVPWVKLK